MNAAFASLMLAAAAPASDYESLLRAFVETDTTLDTGSCTALASKAGQALRRGGIPGESIVPFGDPGRPREGGLLVRLPGSDAAKPPVLLVAHIDTVPAYAPEWTHPPFALTEHGGYYYGRGVADNKAAAALLIELAVSLHRIGSRGPRPVAVGLTCGEETPDAFNGARWLATEGRALVDPALVLVISGGASLDTTGRPNGITIGAGEKIQQNFQLTASGTASHAAQPHPDNAIVTLANGLGRIAAHDFPVQLTAATRLQLAGSAETAPPDVARAIRALLADPDDLTAQSTVARTPALSSLLRTTCTPTMIAAGRQANTVSSAATANVNCRLLPGTKAEDVQDRLRKLVEGIPIAVTAKPPLAEAIPAPPHPGALLATAQESLDEVWPGAKARPAMLSGATDARHFNLAGIPGYGVTILPYESDGSRVHAANERLRIRSVSEGRALLRALVTRLLR